MVSPSGCLTCEDKSSSHEHNNRNYISGAIFLSLAILSIAVYILSSVGGSSFSGISADELLSRPPELTHRLPQVIIGGVRKSGTHALASFLSLHPDIVFPAVEEVHFFDRNYNKGYTWYKHSMGLASPSQIVMETTPAYFTTPGIPKMIRKINSTIKILVVVRDPVKRAISAHLQKTINKPESVIFEKFEDLVVNRKNGKLKNNETVLLNSMYYEHYDRWLKQFPPEQIYFVSGEKLVTDPVEELAGVQEFIGVSRAITNENVVFNETKGFYCNLVNGEQRCLGSNKGRTHPEVESKVIDKLKEFFKPYNKKFYEQSGRDFGW